MDFLCKPVFRLKHKRLIRTTTFVLSFSVAMTFMFVSPQRLDLPNGLVDDGFARTVFSWYKVALTFRRVTFRRKKLV
jgi:hypothetical protein